MKQANFKGLSESAFRRKLTDRTYTGFMGKEIITETWYKLSPEEAGQVIEGNSYLAREIVQASELPEGWIKLITILSGQKFVHPLSGCSCDPCGRPLALRCC